MGSFNRMIAKYVKGRLLFIEIESKVSSYLQVTTSEGGCTLHWLLDVKK